jgi:hypothetical protein
MKTFAWSALVSWVAAGCGDAEPDTRRERAFELVPGAYAEANLEFSRAGATTHVEYTASAAVAWNVHGHEGGVLEVYDEGTATTGTIDWVAARAGGYSFYWENRAAAATVTLTVVVEIGDDVVFDSFVP